jgi:thioredoxin 1
MAIDVTEKTFTEHTQEGKVILDFHAAWCGPCRMLGPILEEVEQEDESVRVVKVNVDDNQDLSTQFAVSSIPKLVFLNEGINVGEMVGLQSKSAIQDKLKSV